jgi:hypothetical protein
MFLHGKGAFDMSQLNFQYKTSSIWSIFEISKISYTKISDVHAKVFWAQIKS